MLQKTFLPTWARAYPEQTYSVEFFDDNHVAWSCRDMGMTSKYFVNTEGNTIVNTQGYTTVTALVNTLGIPPGERFVFAKVSTYVFLFFLR